MYAAAAGMSSFFYEIGAFGMLIQAVMIPNGGLTEMFGEPFFILIMRGKNYRAVLMLLTLESGALIMLAVQETCCLQKQSIFACKCDVTIVKLPVYWNLIIQFQSGKFDGDVRAGPLYGANYSDIRTACIQVMPKDECKKRNILA